MGKKRYFFVLDCEGTGDANEGNQLPYDIGFAVMDRQGNIIEEHSYINTDIFCDGRLMASAYYAKKVPEYIHRLYRQETEPKNSRQILRVILDTMHRYNTRELWAYNVNYDYTALKNMAAAYCGKMDTALFDLSVKPCDIWRAAVDVVYGYRYCKFCDAHGFKTAKGNYRTGAEFGYRFLSNDPAFKEEHRGLDDVRIECAILKKVLDTKRKFTAEPAEYLHKITNAKATHGNKGKARRRKKAAA